MNILALVAYFQRLAVVALAAAYITGDVDVGQKMHFHLDDAISLARLAAATLDVEAETPRQVAARSGLLGTGEQFANRGEQAAISGRVGARRTANWTLADFDDAIYLLQSENFFVRCRVAVGPV